MGRNFWCVPHCPQSSLHSLWILGLQNLKEYQVWFLLLWESEKMEKSHGKQLRSNAKFKLKNTINWTSTFLEWLSSRRPYDPTDPKKVKFPLPGFSKLALKCPVHPQEPSYCQARINNSGISSFLCCSYPCLEVYAGGKPKMY